ncbi:MAG TPA: S8 family serine peptidase [Candidatus Anaerobutyricum faecale]|nr:S8 family serine peptidase [Candidatus Anaerobutyricum faecale]
MMKKQWNDGPGGWRKSGLAVAMSLLLGAGSLLGNVSAAPVLAASVDEAQTAETDGAGTSSTVSSGESSADSGDMSVDVQEITDSQEMSEIISDTWDEDYFGSMVVDTEAGEVKIDGETETLPDGAPGETDNTQEESNTEEDGDQETAKESEQILEDYMDTLPEDNIYDVEETDDGQYEITAPFQTKRLIVETSELQEDYGAEDIYYNTELGETILQFETEEETKAAFEALCEQYGEEKCYPDQVYYVDDILTDDAALSSGACYSWGVAYMGMNTLKAQAEGRYGAVTVAILDTGIDKSNFMFQSRNISSKSYNFIDNNKNVTDNHGHGTHVAGIIADATPSNVRFLILKISNSSGYSSLLTIKTALQYAVNQNVSVVNMSLGFVAANAMSVTYLNSLINKAYRKGIAICTAAGNNGVDVSFCYPACNSKTLAVAAFGPNERAASYSNHGSRIDFSAPGSEVVSAAAGGLLVGMSGTSMSAPHITAAVAYLKMLQPNLSVQGVYNELRARSKDLGAAGKDIYFGWGCPILTNLLTTGILDRTNVVSTGNSLQAPVLKKVKNVSGGIRIAWKKVKKADKYIIYRKKGNGSFKKIKTVSGKKKSWTDTSVTQGRKYTYAVKAVRNKKTSSRSSSKTAVWLRQPKKVKVRSKKGGRLIVTWAKQSGVSGYQIRYSRTKNMKNAVTVTVSGKKARAVLRGLKKKKVYYCRIRAVRTAGGTRYASSWSVVKKIKIK